MCDICVCTHDNEMEFCEECKDMDANCRVYEEFFLDKYHKPIGFIHPHAFKNECCNGKPYILTVNSNNIYSCQCACGGWCTGGHDNPADAIMEYEMMCRIDPSLKPFRKFTYGKYRRFYANNQRKNPDTD